MNEKIKKKFYFYPQFERANNFKSMQNKMERSQSLDIYETTTSNFTDRITTLPKRIRTQSEIIHGSRIDNPNSSFQARNVGFKGFAPRELFGPESLGGTPTEGGDHSNLEESDFGRFLGDSGGNEMEDDPGMIPLDDDSTDRMTQGSLTDWEVLRRTDSVSENSSDQNPGRSNLVIGFFEVLRHAVVLLPDSDLSIVLNDTGMNSLEKCRMLWE